jgi:hypothetical protein
MGECYVEHWQVVAQVRHGYEQGVAVVPAASPTRFWFSVFSATTTFVLIVIRVMGGSAGGLGL